MLKVSYHAAGRFVPEPFLPSVSEMSDLGVLAVKAGMEETASSITMTDVIK